MRRELSGQKFARLLVVDFSHTNIRREVIWNCVCDCGNNVKVKTGSLVTGHTKSCGCYREVVKFSVITHGATRKGSRHPLYGIWNSMRDRCNNPNNPGYHNYGGRGITVCKRWDSFKCFLEDVGERPTPKHTLDRWPDKNGNYGPENFRWATRHEQMANVRYNTWFEYNGETKIMTEWARVFKTQNASILFHLRKGKSFDWIANHFLQKNKKQTA